LLNNFFLRQFGRKKNVEHPLIIFESDDWGCIRMPSKSIKKKIEGISKEYIQDPYLQYDCLETNEDIEILLDLLCDFKDGEGKHPLITANFILQNPDFEKIKEDGYSKFYGEDFRKSYLKKSSSDKVFEKQKEAFQSGLFLPQFHGREHIHIRRWLRALTSNNELAHLAFENEIISLKSKKSPPCISFFMDAFNAEDESDLIEINQIITEGLEMFKDIWGFEASSAIAPCYFWHSRSESYLNDRGIKVIQGIRVQKEARLSGSPYNFKRIVHQQGDTNKFGQKYYLRNAFFEPSLDCKTDWIGQCLNQVGASISKFGYAIISVHRVNFIGAIELSNRDKNIIMFRKLLKGLHENYPGIKYGSSLDLPINA
jgi:hypothetical protein